MEKETTNARRSIGARRNPASSEAILEAAAAVLAENGHAGFSIEAVARRARAGKPTIYRWWPSKAALLLEVYQRQKRVEHPNTGSLEEDLFVFLRSLFAHWRETASGSIFRSIVAEAQSDPAAEAALREYGADRRGHSGRIVERAIARGEVDAGADPDLVMDLLSSYAWGHLLTGRLDRSDAELRAAVAILANGVLKRERRA